MFENLEIFYEEPVKIQGGNKIPVTKIVEDDFVKLKAFHNSCPIGTSSWKSGKTFVGFHCEKCPHFTEYINLSCDEHILCKAKKEEVECYKVIML